MNPTDKAVRSATFKLAQRIEQDMFQEAEGVYLQRRLLDILGKICERNFASSTKWYGIASQVLQK